MKIAFIYDFVYPYHVGGIERINRIESETLAKSKKYEVHFFTMQWEGMQKDFIENDVHYHTFGSATIESMYRHRRRSIRKSIIFSISMFRLFKYRFDALIIDEFPFTHIIPILIYSKIYNVRLIMRVAEVWGRKYWIDYAGFIFGNLGYFLSRMVVNSADLYITNSSHNAKMLNSEFGIKQNSINVFTPVIDYNLMSEVKKGFDGNFRYDVFFAGRLIKEKRIDLFIEIIRRVKEKKPNIKAIIIGDGPERIHIASIIKKYGLENNIKMVMPIKKNLELYSVMCKSHLLLNMSEREGLSMITLESLALGTPAIIPTNSPIPNEVGDMCIKADFDSIPSVVIKIIDSQNKSTFIKNSGNLKRFYYSEISSFYAKLFRRISR